MGREGPGNRDNKQCDVSKNYHRIIIWGIGSNRITKFLRLKSVVNIEKRTSKFKVREYNMQVLQIIACGYVFRN